MPASQIDHYLRWCHGAVPDCVCHCVWGWPVGWCSIGCFSERCCAGCCQGVLQVVLRTVVESAFAIGWY